MLVACSKGTHSSLKRPADSFSSSADAFWVQTCWQASRAPLPKPWQEELMGKAGAQKAAAVEAKKTCSKWKLCSAKAGAAHTWAAQQHTSSREAAAAGPPCCLELLLHITGCILLPASPCTSLFTLLQNQWKLKYLSTTTRGARGASLRSEWSWNKSLFKVSCRGCLAWYSVQCLFRN